MNTKYRVYRPQFLNTDVYERPTGYYDAPDVTATPLSTVGSLHDAFQNNQPTTSKAPVTAPTKPSMPKPVSIKYVEPVFDTLMRIGSFISASVYAVRNAKWAPKKYELYRGLHTNYSTRTFNTAKFAAPSLAVVAILISIATIGPGTPTGPGVTTKPPASGAKAQGVLTGLTKPTQSSNTADDDVIRGDAPDRTTPNPAAQRTKSVALPQPQTLAPAVGGRGSGVEVEPMTPPAATNSRTFNEPEAPVIVNQPGPLPADPVKPEEPSPSIPVVGPIMEDLQGIL